VKLDAEAELVVSRTSISDRTFLEMMERKGLHKVLDEGARLIVGLTIKPESPPKKELKPLLKPSDSLWKEFGTTLLEPEYRYDPFFVEVQLAGPSDKQARQFDTIQGGLWLITEGIEAVGLASTTVKLPPEVSDEPVASLNHAYTRLSEAFETWRISHTGNIYKRVLYRERNEKWYPLDVLRNRALQKAEHETAQMLWNIFMAKMTEARSRWTSGGRSPNS
jgi:hypothetical protein